MSGNEKHFRVLFVPFFVLLVSLFQISTTEASKIDKTTEIALPSFAQNTIVKASVNRTDGDGKITLTPMLLSATSVGHNRYQVTYQVGVPASISENYMPASGSSVNHCDSTAVVCATLTLNYIELGNHGWYKSMSNSWEKIDSSLTWSDAVIRADCYSEWWEQRGWCRANESLLVGNPTNGAPYLLTPAFAGSSNRIMLDGVNGIRASQAITLHDGDSTWNFQFCVGVAGQAIIWDCY